MNIELIAIEATVNEIDSPHLFLNELSELINRYLKENESNTPDFILAQYLENCLITFNIATRQREEWYGRNPDLPKFLEPLD